MHSARYFLIRPNSDSFDAHYRSRYADNRRRWYESSAWNTQAITSYGVISAVRVSCLHNLFDAYLFECNCLSNRATADVLTLV